MAHGGGVRISVFGFRFDQALGLGGWVSAFESRGSEFSL